MGKERKGLTTISVLYDQLAMGARCGPKALSRSPEEQASPRATFRPTPPAPHANGPSSASNANTAPPPPPKADFPASPNDNHNVKTEASPPMRPKQRPTRFWHLAVWYVAKPFCDWAYRKDSPMMPSRAATGP